MICFIYPSIILIPAGMIIGRASLVFILHNVKRFAGFWPRLVQ